MGGPAKRRFKDWLYSLDFNERCPNVRYVLDFEHQLKGKAPSAFDRVQYIEQPTARDLAGYYALRPSDARRCIAELVEDGELVAVSVDGWKDVVIAEPGAYQSIAR